MPPTLLLWRRPSSSFHTCLFKQSSTRPSREPLSRVCSAKLDCQSRDPGQDLACPSKADLALVTVAVSLSLGWRPQSLLHFVPAAGTEQLEQKLPGLTLSQDRALLYPLVSRQDCLSNLGICMSHFVTLTINACVACGQKLRKPPGLLRTFLYLTT